MNVLQIAIKNIRQRRLASVLTGLSVALGVMLMVGVLVFSNVVNRSFGQDKVGYDLVVGPKGSDLQLVLSSVYRIVPPNQALPYRYYEQLRDRPDVETAIPVVIGDNTEEGGFPIVGTTGLYFETDYAPGEPFRLTKNSRAMNNDFDAIIGSEVARTNDWSIGSTFKLVHAGDNDHVHDEKFEVVGVLMPTGTPNDKSVFINIDGFFLLDEHEKPINEIREQWVDYFGESMTRKEFDPVAARVQKEREREKELHAEGGHDHHHHHHATPDEFKGVSSVFLVMKSDPNVPGGASASTSALLLSAEINVGTKAQAVNPIIPMNRLRTLIIGNIRIALLVMTVMIIIVSGISIFVSIYNSMADRRREIAVMRALGAQRTTVFAIILCESAILCVLGGLAGVLLGHGLVFVAAPIVEARTGLLLDPLAWDKWELIVLPVMIVLASLVGFIPGLTAYRTDVATTLAPGNG